MTGMSLATFLAGVGVGLAVAVPIGPMGVLCIQRTLAFGLVAGLATGLGAATVHLTFGSVAALGLGATMSALFGAGAQGLTCLSAGLLFWFAARILSAPLCQALTCRSQRVGFAPMRVPFCLVSPIL
jgi:threonine/homoserine/homoserine lactone efflux protein